MPNTEELPVIELEELPITAGSIREVISPVRRNRMELIARQLENFEGHGPVSQIILAVSAFDHPGKDFPHMVETALRRGDATVLGQLIITAVARWRDAEAEGKTRGL